MPPSPTAARTLAASKISPLHNAGLAKFRTKKHPLSMSTPTTTVFTLGLALDRRSNFTAEPLTTAAHTSRKWSSSRTVKPHANQSECWPCCVHLVQIAKTAQILAETEKDPMRCRNRRDQTRCCHDHRTTKAPCLPLFRKHTDLTTKRDKL